MSCILKTYSFKPFELEPGRKWIVDVVLTSANSAMDGIKFKVDLTKIEEAREKLEIRSGAGRITKFQELAKYTAMELKDKDINDRLLVTDCRELNKAKIRNCFGQRSNYEMLYGKLACFSLAGVHQG